MTSSISENTWRQSEDYFSRVEVQLQQRHEEILARRAALMSGKEAFYDQNSGLPEIFIGSDSQAKKRNDALFQTLQSIRHDFESESQEEDQHFNRLKKAYLQTVQDSMLNWIDQLKEFKLRQIHKIGEERWNSDEDYQAIDAIIRYRPSRIAPSGSGGVSSGGSGGHIEPAVVVVNAPTVETSRPRQLAASVPDLSASGASAASAPGGGNAGGGGPRRGSASRLGAFLSSSWSNLRSRMSRNRRQR